MIHLMMCPLDRCLLVRPALNVYRAHCSGPHGEDGREDGDEKPLSLLDAFAFFLTRRRYSAPAQLPPWIHTRLLLNDFSLFSQNPVFKGQRFASLKDVQKKYVRLWPRPTSLSPKVSGQFERAREPLSSGSKDCPFLAL